MKEDLTKFMEVLSRDKEAENELKALVEGLTPEDQLTKALEYANAKGFDISREDLVDDGKKVDLDEMEQFAGGGGCGCAISGTGVGKFAENGDHLYCICVAVGAGAYGSLESPDYDGRCMCAAVGAGTDPLD